MARSEITLSFTLKCDRTPQGKTRITRSRLIGDANQEQALGAATLSAIAGCFSIETTDRLRGRQPDGRTASGSPPHARPSIVIVGICERPERGDKA